MKIAIKMSKITRLNLFKPFKKSRLNTNIWKNNASYLTHNLKLFGIKLIKTELQWEDLKNKSLKIKAKIEIITF